ncbi:protein TRI1 [Quercus robur]|uniref:DM2 domain-containing protein n=1 Tax=Quercus lobata TaxID=97700 RepID=A0A7N2LGE3_QUELO|nr:protein TRI1 [Quercus lobata]XP_050280714.1 protein TRI1 [Quercus robur]
MASSGIRALRGCRALLAPAKSSASSASAAEVIKTTTSKQPKPKATAKPKPTKTAKATPSTSTTVPKRASGIQKVSPISPQLQTFLGAPEASRSDAVKQIWSYIKLHNLQNPADKREIYCDEKLKGLFDGKDKVGFLEIGKLLFRHFIKTE